MASLFELSSSKAYYFDPSEFTIVQDSFKGRCLQTNKSHEIGDIILEEEALVSASYLECSKRDMPEILLKAFGKVQFKQLDVYEEELAAMDQIQSLDTARCFLQLIALSLLKEQGSNPSESIPDFVLKMNLLSQLSVSSQSSHLENVECVRQFRSIHPKLIPKKFSNEQAGKLLGVLRTNQHELEQLRGSGLFVTAAIMEHDCFPSCSFSTHSNRIYITAIKQLHPGDRLSIDYGNNYYSPTAERIEYLRETYGFTCTCITCTGPDRKRAFHCNSCPPCEGNGFDKSYICPIGYINDAELANTSLPINPNPWSSCITCGLKSDDSYIQACMDRESHYISNPPTTIAELNTLLQEHTIHPTHYIVFLAYDEISVALSTQAKSAPGNSNLLEASKNLLEPSRSFFYKNALEAMATLGALLDCSVMPPVHHEKVVIHDKIAQLAVAAGEIQTAAEHYRVAYDMSVLACGETAPTTLSLRELAANTPSTMAELVAIYARDDNNNMMLASDEEEEGDDIDDVEK